MNSVEALSTWAAVCEPLGIQWSLFKETLLCVNGYHHLPDSVPCAQIVVRGIDLPDLVEYVFPRLPKDWKLNNEHFIDGKKQLVFYAKKAPVLEISVLYAADNDSQVSKLSSTLKQKGQKAANKIKCLRTTNRILKKFCFLRILRKIYNKTIGKAIKLRLNKIINKAFNAAVTLAGDSDESLSFYSDCFTNKKPILFHRELFLGESVLLSCFYNASVEQEPVEETASTDAVKAEIAEAASNEVAEENAVEQPTELFFPAFSGYREYLEAVYGDYENGLFDEIGCGLTTEEKEELKKHQARCFEALTFLQNLSQEFGLRYYLIAGSVLGAIRHGGFIPWDDDIDIGIRVEEIKKFEEVVKAHMSRLPEGFTLEQSGANNPYPRMFSKICYEGRGCIDFWPLIPTYCEGFKAKYLWYFGKIITKVHYAKIGHEVTKFQKIVRPASLLLSDKCVMAMARKNERKYIGKKTPAYINLYSIYKRNKETMKRTWLDDGATAMFNGLEVPVVGHTKVYLTHLYGNFMGFPLPWKRVSRHVARFGTENEN